MARVLIVIGLLFVAAGVFVWLGGSFSWLGRLPGDIRIERENTKVFIPITSSLLASVLLSLLFYLFSKGR